MADFDSGEPAMLAVPRRHGDVAEAGARPVFGDARRATRPESAEIELSMAACGRVAL
jgi:hypothetical protein